MDGVGVERAAGDVGKGDDCDGAVDGDAEGDAEGVAGFAGSPAIGVGALGALVCASSHFRISACPRLNWPTSALAFFQSADSISTPVDVSENTD